MKNPEKNEYCVQLWLKGEFVTCGRGQGATFKTVWAYIKRLRSRSSVALFLLLRPRIVDHAVVWSSAFEVRDFLLRRTGRYKFSTLERNYQAAITPLNFTLRILTAIKRNKP